MRSIDVPQADSIESIRRVVSAIARGHTTKMAVARVTAVAERHVLYRLHAARVLGWVTEQGGQWSTTASGNDLLATVEGSAEERHAVRRAIISNPLLQRLAPRLLAPDAPSSREIASAIRGLTHPPLAEATSRRRAQSLLAWRRFVVEPTLDLGPTANDASGRHHQRHQASHAGAMLSLVQVRNYGLLRSASVPVDRFQVLVGRNSTGKSTFFDAISLVSDILRDGVAAAVGRRCAVFEELLWRFGGDSFAVALEFALPDPYRSKPELAVARYELQVGHSAERGPVILSEVLYLRPDDGAPAPDDPGTVPTGWRKVLCMTTGGTASARAERGDSRASYTLDPGRPMLAWLPPDVARYPAALAVRDSLTRGVQRIELRPEAIARPCSPLLGTQFQNDGANLALVVAMMQDQQPAAFDDWLAHLQEILPDVRAVEVTERAEDRHMYIRLIHRDGTELPVWRLSDGTRRVLALSLLSFVDSPGAIYLVEEPENGVHPQAIEALYQSLSTSPTSQLLVATHSPVLVGAVPLERLLCFTVDHGATVVTLGSDHARLKRWRQNLRLGDLFATGAFE